MNEVEFGVRMWKKKKNKICEFHCIVKTVLDADTQYYEKQKKIV